MLRSRNQKLWESRSRIFYLRLRNPAHSHRSHSPVCMLVTWLVLPTCQLGLQQNISWGQFFCSHRWNVSTNQNMGFASFGQDSRLPDRRVPGRLLRSQHWPSLITPLSIKIPAYSDPMKRCGTFARLIGVAFSFLQVNPSRDFHPRKQKPLEGIPGILQDPAICG